RAARAAGRARGRRAPVHEGHGVPPPGRPLGGAGGGRAGRVHRVDGARQAAPPAPAGPARGQGGARGHARDVISHPDKLLFPEDGITKGELAAYYDAVATPAPPLLLPPRRGRPVTMERYPSGIGRKGFWQKDVSRGFPDWLTRVEVPKEDGVVHHPLARDARSLLCL